MAKEIEQQSQQTDGLREKMITVNLSLIHI